MSALGKATSYGVGVNLPLKGSVTVTEPSPASSDFETNWAGRSLDGSFISVVVPAKNEAASLSQLIGEASQALRLLSNRVGPHRLSGFEILVVDDASTDSTSAVLQELSSAYPELRVLALATSVGQSAATVAGIRAAQGNWIATSDADLQNNPADLVRLWDALPGFDAVLGVRVNRHDVWLRRATSWCANHVRNALLGQSICDTGCSLRIFPRELALRLPVFHGMHRFWGPLMLREGCRLIQVPVQHRPRRYGRSHYNLRNRLIGTIFDLFGVSWLTQRGVGYHVEKEYGFWEGRHQ
jgi:glycosyltransferase involved in cell wall biosynthesis